MWFARPKLTDHQNALKIYIFFSLIYSQDHQKLSCLNKAFPILLLCQVLLFFCRHLLFTRDISILLDLPRFSSSVVWQSSSYECFSFPNNCSMQAELCLWKWTNYFSKHITEWKFALNHTLKNGVLKNATWYTDYSFIVKQEYYDWSKILQMQVYRQTCKNSISVHSHKPLCTWSSPKNFQYTHTQCSKHMFWDYLDEHLDMCMHMCNADICSNLIFICTCADYQYFLSCMKDLKNI